MRVLGERFLALGTDEGLFPGMCSEVSGQIPSLRELGSTFIADERPLSSMYAVVTHQALSVGEFF